VLDEMINYRWRTETTARTDKNGKAQFRGFIGDYRLEAALPSGPVGLDAKLRANSVQNDFVLRA
jgi:hypothetical protein